jgi:HEAT repeat protein
VLVIVVVVLGYLALERPRDTCRDLDTQEAPAGVNSSGELQPAAEVPREVLEEQAIFALPVAALYEVLADRKRTERERNDAANVLLSRRDEALAPALMRMFGDPTESERWRHYCLQLLTSCYTQRPRPEIVATYKRAVTEEPRALKACALLCLAELAEDSVEEPRLDAASVAWARRECLGALGDESADAEVRAAAAHACASLKLGEAVPTLLVLAGTEDAVVALRSAAIAALAKLDAAQAKPLLQRLIESPNPRIRAVSEHALSRLSGSEAKSE